MARQGAGKQSEKMGRKQVQMTKSWGHLGNVGCVKYEVAGEKE